MKIIKISEKIDNASVLLRNNKGKFLILKRSKKSNHSPNKWNLPGGSIEDGESHKEAAIRECEEETGITPQNISHFGDFGKMTVFIGSTDEKPKINSESSDWKFIKEKEVKEFDFVRYTAIVLNKAFEK